jgi:hypothetical protein
MEDSDPAGQAAVPTPGPADMEDLLLDVLSAIRTVHAQLQRIEGRLALLPLPATIPVAPSRPPLGSFRQVPPEEPGA